ncbi:MAG TPA: hypothetical protein PLR91_08715 [Kiritimatiellia bacterium]|nr:hypothetical protein [Kiritimatiellia bacterium]
MSRIYDNIDLRFEAGLKGILGNSGMKRADFCAGYFNLRGWRMICDTIDALPGDHIYEGNEVYLKIIYHLSQEARNGMPEYNLPAVFERELFDFQANAVKLIARRLEKNGGAMIGDVVGLGKTITACASAPNSGSTRFLMAISGMSSIRCSPPTNSNAPWTISTTCPCWKTPSSFSAR